MRIGFTDPRLTAHGGLAVWTRFITEWRLREQLRAVLPHAPSSPNAYDPCDTALGFIGGILCGADKLARVAHLAHDPAVAEVPQVAHFWLRPGNTACVSGAATFLGDTLARLPHHVRVALVRSDSGFCTRAMIAELDTRGLHYILTAALRTPIRTLCRHDDAAWTATAVPGIEVQDITHEGARLVVLRQRTSERPQAGGKLLLEMPGYKFQALRTNLPASVSALEVWRRYNGRADIENRIKELGAQFGLKGLCCRSFWATEAACLLAICAYNPCVALQRRLAQPQRAELTTLRCGLQPRRRQTHPSPRRRLRLTPCLVAGPPATTRFPRQLLCSCRLRCKGRSLPPLHAFNCMTPAQSYPRGRPRSSHSYDPVNIRSRGTPSDRYITISRCLV